MSFKNLNFCNTRFWTEFRVILTNVNSWLTIVKNHAKRRLWGSWDIKEDTMSWYRFLSISCHCWPTYTIQFFLIRQKMIQNINMKKIVRFLSINYYGFQIILLLVYVYFVRFYWVERICLSYLFVWKSYVRFDIHTFLLRISLLKCWIF